MASKAADNDVTDLTRGIYRRQYGNFPRGKRICAVALPAEAWFWRINAVCDDFGNAIADPQLCRDATVGRRSDVTTEQVGGWLDEMAGVDLIRFYQVGDERFLHVVGFCDADGQELQPAGKNGKRVRKFPPSPWDGPGRGNGSAEEKPIDTGESGVKTHGAKRSSDKELRRVNPGESKGKRVQAGAASATHSHSHPHSQNQSALAAPASAEPPHSRSDSAASAPIAVGGGGAVETQKPVGGLLLFPCVAGKNSHAPSWWLTESMVAEWRETWPGVDVLGESRKALAWVRAKPANRKTAGGMKEFLFRWFQRVQNRGGGGGGGGPAGGAGLRSREQARAAEIDAAMDDLKLEEAAP